MSKDCCPLCSCPTSQNIRLTGDTNGGLIGQSFVRLCINNIYKHIFAQPFE